VCRDATPTAGKVPAHTPVTTYVRSHVFASVWASSARPRPGSRGEERARWQGYSPPPTSADHLARRIVIVVDPLSRAAVMQTPRASAPCSDVHELEER